MMNGTLEDFVAAVGAQGQIRYGDVRRLQRDILPAGILSREEAEVLIALNARLVRADRAWAQWLVAAVAAFVANQEENEPSIRRAAGEWLGRLGAPASTRFGRSVAHKLRRALGSPQDGRAQDADTPSSCTSPRCEQTRRGEARSATAKAATAKAATPKAAQAKATKSKAHKRSPRRAIPRCARTPRAGRGAAMLADTGFGFALPGYLPAMPRGHFMSFASAPVGPVLAPYR